MQRAKAIECFSTTRTVYLREIEMNKIKRFINSSETILHITGRPGTGKTAVVRYALSEEKYEYMNYFNELDIGKRLKDSKEQLFVIDEFDKYLEEKKKECLRSVLLLRKQGRKLITISNDLRIGNIRFQPYTLEELETILKKKMETELGKRIMDDKCISFVAKKYEKAGDLRGLFCCIQGTLSMKDELKRENKQNSEYLLEIEDFVENRRKNIQSVHHKIITKIKAETMSKKTGFKMYLNECDALSISSMSRMEFEMAFDI
ncbi:Origin recognition complex [Glugoides intestinalis]